MRCAYEASAPVLTAVAALEQEQQGLAAVQSDAGVDVSLDVDLRLAGDHSARTNPPVHARTHARTYVRTYVRKSMEGGQGEPLLSRSLPALPALPAGTGAPKLEH